MSEYNHYSIWKMNAFVVGSKWTPLKGFGLIRARTMKEAQSRIDRKMRKGQHSGYCFIPVTQGQNPNDT